MQMFLGNQPLKLHERLLSFLERHNSISERSVREPSSHSSESLHESKSISTLRDGERPQCRVLDERP